MSKHLFGLVVTPYGTAANNRGETIAPATTTLQKIIWNGDVHTTVSAEAIRWAIRWHWQRKLGDGGLNRQWKDGESRHIWQDAEFQKWAEHLDDDVLGFMSAKAAKEETNEAESGDKATTSPKGVKKRPRGTIDKRRARLEITRAISLTSWPGDVTFNAASIGATPSASSTGKDPVPYATELHATRYQYGFALTPEDLEQKERALEVVDAIVNLSEVAGNHARFLYDFSPDSVIFRWTDDFAPRMLYGFRSSEKGNLTIPDVIRCVKAGDIDPKELIIGGSIGASEEIKGLPQGVVVKDGVKAAAEEIKTRMAKHLQIKI
jgi:CRISPR-associated protein Cst2